MEREYRVLLHLDLRISAESPSEAEDEVMKELEDAGRDVLELKVDPIPVPLCPATLQAVRASIVHEMTKVDKQIVKEEMRKGWDHMGGKINRDDVREEIADKKPILTRIFENADRLYDTRAIYTVEAVVTVDVFADSDKEALEGAEEQLEKAGRYIFDSNIEEVRR